MQKKIEPEAGMVPKPNWPRLLFRYRSALPLNYSGIYTVMQMRNDILKSRYLPMGEKIQDIKPILL